MKINNEFTVSAPVEKAWETMLDLERVAPCLPGAAIRGGQGDEYQGTMKVKIGPVIADYKGTVKIEEADERARRTVVRAVGRDTRGQGTASATIVSTMQEENGGKTRVSVETDMDLTGRAAQFGRGIAQDVATKMLDQFAARLEQEITNGRATTRPEETVTATHAVGGAPEEGPSAGRSETGGTPPREAEPLDLGAVSREAVLKRAAPVAASVVGLTLTVLVAMRLRRRPSFLIVVKNFEVRAR